MRRLVLTIVSVLATASVSFGQVDTLQLVEIGSIQAPSAITDLYVEDLNGDSLKEIILTTAANVHIYNGVSRELIWTSPNLNHPRDLLFTDINNDGFVDFSEKDTTNIRLFDPHNNGTIWTSPAIDSTYKCYTVGDRNDDGWVDVAIVSKEPFKRPMIYSNKDTVWVDIYDGPDFGSESGFILLAENWVAWGAGWFWQHIEIPIEVGFETFSGNDGLLGRFIVFTETTDTGNAPGGMFWNYVLGNLWIVDADDYSYRLFVDVGTVTYFECLDSDGSIFLHSLSQKYRYWSIWGEPTEDDLHRNVNSHSADSFLDSTKIWDSHQNNSEWKGVIIDNANFDNDGLELCFSSDDSISLSAFPSMDNLWLDSGIAGLDSLLFIFKASSLFGNPQVICQTGVEPIEYRFYSGSNGSLTAILPYQGHSLSRADNINNDGDDEILSIEESDLSIYVLYRTAIDDDITNPYKTFLLSNYPNPFNSSTAIEYSLPDAGRVTIEIYDLLGRKIKTLVNGEQEAGTYRVTWNAESQASGVYFYRIKAGEYEDARRMVLLK